LVKPSYGIIVGRFQVHELHPGHLSLIRAVQDLHDRVVVFIGTSPTLATKRNPLDFITRKRMLQRTFPDLTVIQMPDRASNEAWSQALDRRIREIAPFGHITLYGARDSFVPSYTGAFTPVELPILVEGQSGEETRANLSNRILESSDFRAGVIYSTQNRWPISIQCVDIAIFDEATGKLALGRKSGEKLWRFPGGHVDPTDSDLEAAARREGREETGLETHSLEYVTSHRVDDWRYRKEADKIMTTLFKGVNGSGVLKAGDDLEEAAWHTMPPLDGPGSAGATVQFIQQIVPEHRPLIGALILHLGKSPSPVVRTPVDSGVGLNHKGDPVWPFSGQR